ncbi:MAG: carbamoyl-phosphate synthase large subunit [Euryarchaeota archaeon]|nr:carbamoyl-phosphate synthase large subunit [Euryarchaeota archaeon]
MPKRADIEKVLLIGSGPIVIGQAAEFDFSGSQACTSLREEGVKVALVNSNPATIMTDPNMADAVYIEPLKPDIVAAIVKKEQPDGIIAGLGGQTGLNITAELAEMGVLAENGVEPLGTPLETIYLAEDREQFRNTMEGIGEEVPRSYAVYDSNDYQWLASELGLPVIVRSAYTLGGGGSGIARTEAQLKAIIEGGIKKSRIGQVLVEESVLGWKEFEYEVMRDSGDTCITICNMENIDPMGVHTGESIVVTPSQTLSDVEHQMLRSASIRIIRALKIEGGCNIQFAFKDGEYRVIEVNPRVSRSSALASKATGYPIARVSAKIAIGMQLIEIPNRVTNETPASFEPTIDYTVIKIPRWPFDKFTSADNSLGTAMKSTGEVMAIGRTLEESLQKAIRSLDLDLPVSFSKDPIDLLSIPTDKRLFQIYSALKNGHTIAEIARSTSIDPFFIRKILNIVDFETYLQAKYRNGKAKKMSADDLRRAKRLGFTDEQIAELTGFTREKVTDLRHQRTHDVKVTYKMVDTCAAEFKAQTPYYYSTYEQQNEIVPTDKTKVLIVGAGPIRIGQGIEFDYCTVHAVLSLREEGIEAHIINNNPETVSTDYDTSDKLFFEPLTLEDVMNVIEQEEPQGVLVQFGGQTSVNLAIPLEKEIKRRGLSTRILGTSPDSIDIAEDRDRFSRLLKQLAIPQPESGSATSREDAIRIAREIGFPLLVRPSYVLGGRAMEIVYDESQLDRYIEEAVKVSRQHPVLIDKFLQHAVEIDIDAVSDGDQVLVPAIMEHIEEAGIHSGDSAVVIPAQSIDDMTQEIIKDYVTKIAKALNVVGLINLQMAIKDDTVYVLEANPRSSRTIPYVSKATGLPLAKIAAKVIVGHSLRDLCPTVPKMKHVAVKEVVLPFEKLPGVDPILGPEMKSTGEVMGIDYDFGRAFYKAALASDNELPLSGTVFISVRDEDKPELCSIAKSLYNAGFKLLATEGTANYLKAHDVEVERVPKLTNSPELLEMMRGNGIQLIINTPTWKQSRLDGEVLRRAAVDHGVPYITSVQGARASADAIHTMLKHYDKPRAQNLTIRPINNYISDLWPQT